MIDLIIITLTIIGSVIIGLGIGHIIGYHRGLKSVFEFVGVVSDIDSEELYQEWLDNQ